MSQWLNFFSLFLKLLQAVGIINIFIYLFNIIGLQGFIGDRIEKDNRNSRLTCGSGAITDGHVQVQVNVFDIPPTDEPFKVGTHVKVCGQLTRDKNCKSFYN